MATQRLLETRNTTFGELLGNGRRYKVPAFQRDYAWQPENWEDLWQDLLVAHKEGLPHFMGAIVTQTLENEPVTFQGDVVTFEGNVVTFGGLSVIIDGQQRLVTLSILAIAVIERIQKLSEEGIETEANQGRQEILRRTYLGDRDPSSLRYSSKLSLNENDDGFYQNNLVNLRRPRFIRSFTKSEQLLWQAFEYFSHQLTSEPKLSQSGALLANFLNETVAKRLLFIQISVEEANNAYVLFETLNSRGVELGAVDLLKNYIFSLLQGPDDLNAARYEWQRIVRTVGMKNLPAFLYCVLSMVDSGIRHNRQLFKAIRQRVTNAEQAFALLTQLSDYSNFYVALSNANDDLWKQYAQRKQVSEWIRLFNLFETPQFRPVLLAASERFNDGKFTTLLKTLAMLAFRYIVSGLNSNELENRCSILATEIYQGTVKSPKAAFDQLSSLYVEDHKFKQDFSFLVIANHRKNGLLKYILRQLERESSGKDVTEDSFSIEHILPQNPDGSWEEGFTGQNTTTLIYRLGNLTLLEPNLNSALGRANYTDKRATFAQSAYTITTSIQAEEWTANAIVSRQEKMAEQAVKIWQLNDYRE